MGEYFNDGVRRIDLVLVYEKDDEEWKSTTRAAFEAKLREKGLELEKSESVTPNQNFVFLKIHAPLKVLFRFTEMLNWRLPFKEVNPRQSWLIRKFGDYIHHGLEEKPIPLRTTFREDFKDKFITEDTFLTHTERSVIVWEILWRTEYGDGEYDKGAHKLIELGVYNSVYPLHEGSYLKDPNSSDPLTDRQLLYENWAKPKNFYKTQPLDLIAKYFGAEVGLYFAWLGTYTFMLVPAVLIGFIALIYGLVTMDCDYATPSREICESEEYLCPVCKDYGECGFQEVKESCNSARISYLFETDVSVFFAAFMCVWACVLMELWDRKEAELKWRWDLRFAEMEQESRPEYEQVVKKIKYCPLTDREQIRVSRTEHKVRVVTSWTCVSCVIFAMLLTFFGITVAKVMITRALLRQRNYQLSGKLRELMNIFSSVVYLIVMMLLHPLYSKAAKWLTKLELQRTRREHDDSFTLKFFTFEFVNFYGYQTYIAFFKGHIYTHPGDDEVWDKWGGLAMDFCHPSGCLVDLLIQLAIIMIGRQLINNIAEVLVPKLKVWLARRKAREVALPRWEEDFKLLSTEESPLANEYEEMVVQYGFVTFFVAAFHMAPLFALINNIAELRIDAFKMLTHVRRPIPRFVTGLGPWKDILKVITVMAVPFNAFVIAMTTEFIPHSVYYYQNNDLEGYFNYSMAEYPTSLLKTSVNSVDKPDFETCRFRSFRGPPDYDIQPAEYWRVLAFRLAFIVAFEHIVFILSGIIAYAIPDIPYWVKELIIYERLEAIESHMKRK